MQALHCVAASLLAVFGLLLLTGEAEARCWLEDCTLNPNAGYGCGAPPSRCQRPEPQRCDTTEPGESVATDPRSAAEPIGVEPVELEEQQQEEDDLVPIAPDETVSKHIVPLSLLGVFSSVACLYWKHREEQWWQQAHDAKLAQDQAEEQRRQERHEMERVAHDAEQRRRDELLGLERCRAEGGTG